MIAPRSAEHPARRPIDRPPRGKKHAGHEGSFLSAHQLFEQSRRSLQSLLGVVRRDLVKGQASGRRPTHRVRDLTSCGERHYIAAGCVAQYRAKPCAPADPHGRRCAGCWCALPDVGGHSFDGRERVRPHPVFLGEGAFTGGSGRAHVSAAKTGPGRGGAVAGFRVHRPEHPPQRGLPAAASIPGGTIPNGIGGMCRVRPASRSAGKGMSTKSPPPACFWSAATARSSPTKPST